MKQERGGGGGSGGRKGGKVVCLRWSWGSSGNGGVKEVGGEGTSDSLKLPKKGGNTKKTENE